MAVLFHEAWTNSNGLTKSPQQHNPSIMSAGYQVRANNRLYTHDHATNFLRYELNLGTKHYGKIQCTALGATTQSFSLAMVTIGSRSASGSGTTYDDARHVECGYSYQQGKVWAEEKTGNASWVIRGQWTFPSLPTVPHEILAEFDNGTVRVLVDGIQRIAPSTTTATGQRVGQRSYNNLGGEFEYLEGGNLTVATGPTWHEWNGSTKQLLTLRGEWNGSIITPVTFKEVT